MDRVIEFDCLNNVIFACWSRRSINWGALRKVEIVLPRCFIRDIYTSFRLNELRIRFVSQTFSGLSVCLITSFVRDL